MDLSTVANMNPTKTIEEHYALLMAETDVVALAKDVIELVDVKGGISESNKKKFKMNVAKESTNLDRLKYYITNFLLSGCGLSVIKTGR